MPSTRLPDQIADKLEQIIAARRLKAGDRLPAERKLAEDLQVSRSSLREGIQRLASRGVLVSRMGGGTYVAEPSPGWSNDAIFAPLESLMLGDPEYRFDVLEIRHALDGAAAWHAAMRATPQDKDRLRESFEHMIAMHGSDDPMAEARADAAFHLAIAEASHNLVLLQVTRALFDLLQVNISQNLEKLYTLPKVFEPLSAQHRELLEAIVAGDAGRARQAAHVHIDFVHTSLKTIDEDEARKARAFRLPSEKGQTP
ncbi:transcriptional regulator LldR [Paracoccus sp. S3-43]|uniref:transcriptional regulator LldR n=1 Tax=Paracoccus sp. S3-43 TaxID=3030011 RepID=UPI0023AE7C64|nr:transcriptional regulator LldR [Paracoccus sp. S3-43]WEF24701.1 transcriptional regulator LldR [Paracoccus sp. S3-43]